MEPMVTGSPTFYDAVSNTPGVNATPSRSFLPGYLMGHHHRQDIRSPASNIALNASDNRSMMASTMSPSVRPPNLKVTWSPLLDSTNYYEPNNSVAYLQQEDSENYYKMTPRRLTAAGNFPPTPSESTCGPPTASFMESFSTKGVLNGSTLGVEQNTPGSRAAQSVAVNAVADDNSRIVTIFGFTAEFIQFILQHFSQCGTIVAHETANKCNWIHVKFESKLQASKALARNGRILNETLKIGVEQCKDEFLELMVCLQVLYLAFAVKIGSHTKHDLVLKIKSFGTKLASSGTELHPVEHIVQKVIKRLNDQTMNKEMNTTSLKSLLSSPPPVSGYKASSFIKEPWDAPKSALSQNQPRNNMRSLISHNGPSQDATSNDNGTILSKAKSYIFGWQ